MANPLQNWFHSTSSLQPGIRYAAGLWIGVAFTIVAAVSAEPPPAATPVKSIVTRPGFQVELLRSDGPDVKADGNPADPVFQAPGQKKP